MIKFNLDELMVEGLRKLADYYGVPKTVTGKDELLETLKKRMSTDAEVVLGQRAKPWYKTPSIVISIVSVVISAVGIVIAALAMRATWLNAETATNNLERTILRDAEHHQDERIKRLQRISIYAQLQDGSKAGEGLSFEEIKKGYLQYAFATQDIDLKKEHLQDHVLREILMDLMSQNIINQTVNDKYVVTRTLLLRGTERVLLENRAKYHVLNLLSREGGKHTIPELGQILIDKLMITVEEYNLIINELIAARGVVIDEKAKVWSVANPPRGPSPKKD